MLEQLQEWSELAGFPHHVAEEGPAFRLSVTLEDPEGPVAVDVCGPADEAEPYRFRYQFDVPTAGGRALSAERTGAVVEAAVVQRSFMVDARLAGATEIEMVVVIYPDGLTRHGFMTAMFECQKLRHLVRREVESALVSESAIASLTALADASDALSTAVEDALPESGEVVA
jgi:hypothetical protein